MPRAYRPSSHYRPRCRRTLIDLRLGMGLTQEAIARACGISHMCYVRIEDGFARRTRTPKARAYRSIADFFGVSVWDLFFAGEIPLLESLSDDIPADALDLDAAIDRDRQWATVSRLLRELLDEREAFVIWRRCWTAASLREVGEDIGVSAERARQIEQHALGKLRWAAREER